MLSCCLLLMSKISNKNSKNLPFLVLDLCLDVGDRVIGFDVQRNRLSGQGFDEDLHGTTSKTKDKVKGGLFLNVVVRKGTSILKLFTGEDQSLLLRRNSHQIQQMSSNRNFQWKQEISLLSFVLLNLHKKNSNTATLPCLGSLP